MKQIQQLGIVLFSTAFLTWIALNFLNTAHTIDAKLLKKVFSDSTKTATLLTVFALNDEKIGTYGKYQTLSTLQTNLKQAQAALANTPNQLSDYDVKTATYQLIKDSTTPFWVQTLQYSFYWLLLIALFGAFLYILPEWKKPEGIKNNGIFSSSATSRGVIAWSLSAFLISFYVLLYFQPQYLTNWVIMLDSVAKKLNGNGASQWFLYGFLYTVSVLVMGVRMLLKYRHNTYQLVRTGSVMFFQLCFAFMLPQFLEFWKLPAVDLKNMWPLDYSFFFDYRLNHLFQSGKFGLFLLGWGIALFLVGMPLMTYFYGKRWYCSWVCGCGGLAETLGDPFRQLSDKSTKAWKFERYSITIVTVLVTVMTLLVLITYTTGALGISYAVRDWYGFLIGAVFSGVIGTGLYPVMGNRVWCRFGCPLAGYMGMLQRVQSRFRITTNGAQCISCGNCSTYCEQGIDVRAYAQRGQDIVRASCVGCGVCAAVCPRGVLRLENASSDIKQRADQHRVIHVRLEDVRILR